MRLTLRSTLADVWASPVGADVLSTLLRQLGLGTAWVTNPVVRRLRLSQIKALAGSRVGPGFFDALLRLLNTEAPPPNADPATTAPDPWWKRAVFYQIYPRSFKDSNDDGIGDLGGIIEKLDYLRDLGVDALWLSPVYDSPGDDFGYDVRDYRAILAEFGTMEDFDRLLAGVHDRGMRLIMDLVVNHTSDEHAWFQAALRDPAGPYGDYYFFRPGGPEAPPNNWTSMFSGPAWRYLPERGDWALHLFSSKQMDLNWDNPAVRDEVIDLVRWWLDKGVDGFRLDVINFISKQPGLPAGDETIGALIGYRGAENYFYGPHLHEYLRQLRTEGFDPYGAFSVGETPGIGRRMSSLLTAPERAELDMVFNFDHWETPGKVRFDDYRYDLNYFKAYLVDWMTRYPPSCWMSLFYDTHDTPRWISKVEPSGAHRRELATLLAVIQLTLRGTPFLYQGQELGMANQRFTSIDDLRDIESLRLYRELLDAGKPPAEAFARVLAGTRDHARTPVQWTAGPHAGFSQAEPWIRGDGDEATGWNAQDEAADPDSVLSFYTAMIALRRAHRALTDGEVRFVGTTRRDYLGYLRTCEDETVFVECNLSAHPVRRERRPGAFTLLASNYPTVALDGRLRPYEAAVYRVVTVRPERL